MFASEKTNSSPVKKSSTFVETVQDKLKDIKNFSNWSAKEQMVAVGAVGVIFGALLPFVAVALPVAATGAIVALTLFFAYKAVEYTFKGLKWSAEKTVDGAKYTTGKVRDGAVHVRDSVKEAVSSVGQATREGTSSALRAMGDGVQKFGRKMSNGGASMSSLDAILYSIGNEGQTVVLKTKEKTRNFNSVKEMFIKEVLEDKAVNNSVLIKKIFSELKGKILEKAYSVDGQSGFQKDQLINQLKQQADFVNKLDAKKLQNLLSKDNNSLYEIFSEHHDEIKRIIKECKTKHKLSNSIENLNKVAGKYGIRKGSTQSIENSLSKSNSLNSVRTDSTEPPIKVGNSTFYVDTPIPTENTDKTATIAGRPGVARRNSTSNLTRVGTPEVPTRSASLTNLNGQSSFSEDVLSDPKVNQYLGNSNEGTLTRSNSFDSGRGSSGSSTPKRKSPFINLDPFGRVDSGDLPDPLIPKKLNLFQNNLSEARANLKETGYLNELVEQPSTKVDVVDQQFMQVKQSLETSV